jgi:hypothetical protein
MVSVPLREPAVVGVKVTWIGQFAPPATLAPQVFVSAKSPLAATLVIVSAAVPELVRVIVCAALGVLSTCAANVRLAGERVAPGPAPVPVSATVCGLPAALSVMVSVPLRTPGAVGVNVTLIVQLAVGATEVPQLLVSPKSPPFTPLIAILETWSVPLPVFVRVTLCATLAVPSA